MTRVKIAFNVCPDLIVRTDFGHQTNPDHKVISACECKAEQEQRPCRRRGACIKARDDQTWKTITSKSFSVK